MRTMYGFMLPTIITRPPAACTSSAFFWTQHVWMNVCMYVNYIQYVLTNSVADRKSMQHRVQCPSNDAREAYAQLMYKSIRSGQIDQGQVGIAYHERAIPSSHQDRFPADVVLQRAASFCRLGYHHWKRYAAVGDLRCRIPSIFIRGGKVVIFWNAHAVPLFRSALRDIPWEGRWVSSCSQFRPQKWLK